MSIKRIAVTICDEPGCGKEISQIPAAMPLESVERLRARKAAAVRYGDRETAAEADLGLCAHKLAKVIKEETAKHPLPPDVVAALRDLLSGSEDRCPNHRPAVSR